jgi:hypothetical protein
MATHTHLSPDDIARYREIIGGMQMDESQKDDVIRVVHGIMQAFVDISFSNDPVQVSAQSRLIESFRESSGCDTVPNIQKHEIYPSAFDHDAAGLEP